jgi:hypothetical protein
VIIVEPELTPVAVVDVPEDGLTVATEVILLVHAKVLPEISVPSDSRALAVNCCVSSSSIDARGGFTVTVATTGSGGGGGGGGGVGGGGVGGGGSGSGGSVTVNLAVPDIPSTVAVIVVDPEPTAVARPIASMVATVVLPVFQLKVLPVISMSSES